MDEYKKQLYMLSELPVFRDIPASPLVRALTGCLGMSGSTDELPARTASSILPILIDFACANNLRGNIIRHYFSYAIYHSDNSYSISCEKGIDPGESLKQLAREDIKTVQLFTARLEVFLGKTGQYSHLENFTPPSPLNTELANRLSSFWNADDSARINSLEKFWKSNGAGHIALSHIFRWVNNTLIPVKNFDRISFDELSGYDYQKETLVKNTSAFVHNRKGNNILLAGSSGTGKSSCVKAVSNQFAPDALKTVEITKDSLHTLKDLFAFIGSRGMKFLIFMDDISFDEDEPSFRQIKPLLEGLSGSKPENLIIYATSNRRHMIKEKLHSDTLNDIYETDSINEAVSLSDRFGITLLFLPPDQDEYLSMVATIAASQGIVMSDEIRRRALEWSRSGKGRSGRMARQFVDFFAGENHRD